jgi:hypothetical protein
MEKHTGRPAKDSHVERLSDLGITYNNSYRWRALARFSLESLEELWKNYDKWGEELTTAAVMRKLRSQLGPDGYRAMMTPHHPDIRDELARALDRLLKEVWWFNDRFRKRGRLFAAMGVVLDRSDVNERCDERELEKVLGAFLECRQRIDKCIGALEGSLDRVPVAAWDSEARSLLDYLSEEPETTVAESSR